MRHETKFSISEFTINEVKKVIMSHPAVFREIHSKRRINNIYFDDVNLTSFTDNVEGERDRKKVRIRWYGDLFGVCKDPAFEIKYKQGLLGWKENLKIEDFYLDRYTNVNIKNIFKTKFKNLLFQKHSLGMSSLIPTLINSYQRTYYLSFDKKYRITLDNNLLFYTTNPVINFFKTFIDQDKLILELKYDKKDFYNANVISNSLPFRITKSSKYVIGIERLRHWK